MNKILILFVLAGGFAAGTRARAEVSEQTEVGRYTFNQNLTLDRGFGTDKAFDSSLSYTYSKSTSPVSGGPDVIDTSNQVDGALTWQGDSGWELSGTIDYSNTPAERLQARGGSITSKYNWDYGDDDDDDASDFSPELSFGLTASDSNFLESFNGTRRVLKVTKPTSGTAELRQSMLAVDLDWTPVKSWEFELKYSGYAYNRDVASFQSLLDSPTATQRGIGGFSNTVGGVPSHSYSARLTWYWNDNWDARLYEAISRAAADQSTSATDRLTLDDQLTKDWSASLGVERDRSTSPTDVLGILGVSCEI